MQNVMPRMPNMNDESDYKTIFDCRADFPALQQKVNNYPLAYLDTAASAQKPQAVIDAMTEVMETHYANIHRGVYAFSQETTSKYETARQKVAAFIAAPEAANVIFTRNTTEGINLVAHSWGMDHLGEGDTILLSQMEHHANIVPWQLLRDQTGVAIKVIPVRQDGALDLDAFKSMLTPDVKMLALSHMSNALGTINPVKSMIALAREKLGRDIKVLLDGSQAVMHMPVDVQDLDCDFYAFTGHKLYGPSGVGVLYGKGDILNAMRPYQGGGDMIDRVTFEETTYREAPHRFEAGTPAIVEAIGLGAAIDYLNDIGMNQIADHEGAMMRYAEDRLADIEGLRIIGTAPRKASVISFVIEDIHPSDIGMVLDQMGVAVRTGHHCAQPLMDFYGVSATVRASIGLYTHQDDIDAMMDGLFKVKKLFG